MKRTAATLLFLLAISAAFAQDKYLDRKDIDSRTDSIMAEGKALYRSEWASWYGTDIFLEKFKDKRALIGGYLSYETKSGVKNIFLEKETTRAFLHPYRLLMILMSKISRLILRTGN
ncbi:hypothetical protein GWR56_04805 [Mucilaginibacter sp. 14171R-50]|uniref:hypothetical protein n=1 Tax=Mucilaginibacter sp. 14171R-50 TaxID=2703789 RepID=UPI00138DBA97|nr:hypothetical protein [Mucilaginibacter sp. 14171R-50]QHS54899.1 hypothetical protein GWR56_04805 [Mucilaginibacter sp. 14171R-50]